MLSPDWILRYEHVSGNGKLNGTTSDFNFNQNLVYAYREFAEDSFFLLNWKLGYKVGAGFYQKTSKFRTERYNETQFPVLLGVEITNTSKTRRGSYQNGDPSFALVNSHRTCACLPSDHGIVVRVPLSGRAIASGSPSEKPWPIGSAVLPRTSTNCIAAAYRRASREYIFRVGEIGKRLPTALPQRSITIASRYSIPGALPREFGQILFIQIHASAPRIRYPIF